MSNIAKAFENGKAFIPFITCGDPDLETTEKVVKEAVRAGADLIELGIPFSDPTAEGPVIQAASARALSAGTTTDKIFDMVAKLRSEVTIPLTFMTYANVVFSYGAERFISRCKEVGIDGLVLPDIPFEEKEEFLPYTKKSSLTSKVKAASHVPCAIGFGISTPEQARNMAQYADGVIVGSAIVKIIAEYGKEAPSHVYDYVKSMKDAIR